MPHSTRRRPRGKTGSPARGPESNRDRKLPLTSCWISPVAQLPHATSVRNAGFSAGSGGNGAAARRTVPALPTPDLTVSTVLAGPGTADSGRTEGYEIARQPFTTPEAKLFVNQLRWSRGIDRWCRAGGGLVHLGNIRPCGYAVGLGTLLTGTPYLMYVNGGDLLRELRFVQQAARRWSGRQLFSRAWGSSPTRAGPLIWPATRPLASGRGRSPWPRSTWEPIRSSSAPVATAARCGDASGWAMRRCCSQWPAWFPTRGRTSRCAPSRALGRDFPDLRLSGGRRGARPPAAADAGRRTGSRESGGLRAACSATRKSPRPTRRRLSTSASRASTTRSAPKASVSPSSRPRPAASPRWPAIRAGCARAVRDGETGLVVPPTDVDAVTAAVRLLLTDGERRRALGAAGRRAVETHYTWDRVARETLEFARNLTSGPAAAR